MNGKGAATQSSTRSDRWVRIWLGVGVACAVLLLGNSVYDYFFVARILSVQQVRRQVTQHIASFERDLHENRNGEASQIKLLTDEMNTGTPQPLWIILRDMDGNVLGQSGTPEREVFTHDQEVSHFRNREGLFDVIPTRSGDAVVEVFPLHVGGPRPPEGAAPLRHGGPFVAAEVAVPFISADAATLWPIRRNLAINIAAALALLLTVALTAWGFRSYVRGRQLEEQVEIARQLQANLLPRNIQPAQAVQVAVEYQPAQEVGGDFYDSFQTEHGFALVIGDVSGKGIPAALLMGVIHGAVRSSAWTDSRASHEGETSKLNHLLCERASLERFASMFWCYSDPEHRSVHYVNAGHCAPFLIGQRNGQTDIRRLDQGGPVLGVLASADYTQGCAEIQPGDAIFLYSDGLVEATNAAGEEFGEARMATLLSQSAHETPEKIRDAILASVQNFLGEVPAHDDLTCVVAKFG
jgi:hypothetical protein